MTSQRHAKVPNQKEVIEACRRDLSASGSRCGFAFNDDIWVKYGYYLNKGEADIQRYVYKHADHSILYTPKVFDFFKASLENKQSEQWGIIVMEKISGHNWDHYLNQTRPPSKREQKKQLDRIAKAVRHIWEIPVDPTARPGPFDGHEPVGGFFDAVEPDDELQSYHDLEKWINERLLKKQKFDIKFFHRETPEHLKHLSFLPEDPMCIAHCDLNPSNIFVSPQRITVIDWGWAGIYNRLFDLHGILTLQVMQFPSFVKFGIALYDQLFEHETPEYREKLKKRMQAMGRAASR